MQKPQRIGMAVLAAFVVVAAPAAGQERGVRAGRDAPVPTIRQLYVQGEAGPRIGATIRDVEPPDIEREALGSPRGAVVTAVADGSPADEAGVRAGDVIVRFDGETVRSASQLTRLVRETPAGRPIDLAVRRNGARVDLEVTPTAEPPDRGESWEGRLGRLGEELGRRFERLRTPEGSPFRSGPPRLGIGAIGLTQQLADHFGVEEGVLVTEVEDGSPAAAAGLRAGDVITAVDDRGVAGVTELRRRLGRVEPDEAARLAVMRDGGSFTVDVSLDDDDDRDPDLDNDDPDEWHPLRRWREPIDP